MGREIEDPTRQERLYRKGQNRRDCPARKEVYYSQRMDPGAKVRVGKVLGTLLAHP